MVKLLELKTKNDKKANKLFFVETCIVYVIFVVFLILATIFTYIKLQTTTMIILAVVGGVIAVATVLCYIFIPKLREWKYLRWLLLIENGIFITLFTFPISFFSLVLLLPVIISILYADKKFTVVSVILALVCNIISECLAVACKCYDLNILEFQIGTIIEITKHGFYIDIIELADQGQAWRATILQSMLPTSVLIIVFGIVCYIIANNDSNKWISDVSEMYSSAGKDKEKELESNISQNSLALNEIDARPGFTIAGNVFSSHLTNSNFYDYFLIDETHLCLLAGNTSLSGMEALTFVSILKSSIRTYSEFTNSPKEILNRVNNFIYSTSSYKRTASLFLGVLHTRNGKLECADAGGFAPILKKDGKYIPFFTHRNPLVGLHGGIDYEGTTLALNQNDEVLLLATERVSQQQIVDRVNSMTLATQNCKNAKETIEVVAKSLTSQDTYDSAALSLQYIQPDGVSINTQVSSRDMFDSYGGMSVEVTTKEAMELGINYGDLVRVRFLEKVLILPVVPSYTYLLSEKDGLILWKNDKAKISLITFAGNFVNKYKIDSKNVTLPIKVRISLYHKGGYLNEMDLRNLTRTNNREDYPNLSDEEYANFRNVCFGNMKEGILYRGCSPIEARIGRNTYVDNALKHYKVKTAFNLSDLDKSMKENPLYKGSYYSKMDVHCYGLDTDYYSKETRAKLKQLFIDMSNSEGPFYIHCIEGQDRTGFVIGVLECLLGVNYEDLIKDFMKTYMNYYGVEADSLKYYNIAQNLVRELEKAFIVNRLSRANLKQCAFEYLYTLGLKLDEISSLINKLKN